MEGADLPRQTRAYWVRLRPGRLQASPKDGNQELVPPHPAPYGSGGGGRVAPGSEPASPTPWEVGVWASQLADPWAQGKRASVV